MGGKMKDKTEVMTLCYQCKTIMLDTGHTVKRTKKEYKEPCYICKRFGYEYFVKTRHVK